MMANNWPLCAMPCTTPLQLPDNAAPSVCASRQKANGLLDDKMG